MNELTVQGTEEGVAPEPGYYECRKTHRDFAIGELVYFLGVESGKAALIHRGSTWTMGLPSFRADFAPAPDGLARRMAAVAEAAAGLDVSIAPTFNPHIEADGALTGMELTVGQDPLDTKRAVAGVRNQAARMRTELAERTKAIQAFAEEQALILRAKTQGLVALLKLAEEAIWTINLYLGQDEQIVQLADGDAAPADTPITIRQLVLYMDEETAMFADEGGFDFEDMDYFDKWLTENPDHLKQVLPEAKGMVALKPRRKQKDYNTGSAWSDAQLDAQNRKTYFILRNGGKLFRMWTKYEVTDHLVPRTNEFVKYSDGEKPGSERFMRAEKDAEVTRRHYMRAALILQGLIDRTPVFHPLAWTINVGNEASYVEALNVVLDADAMLSDGRERFRDWLKRINGELTVGMRVVGAFGNWEHGLRRYEDRNYGVRRINPSRADLPASDAIYTLEEATSEYDEPGFSFYYKRTDKGWSRYGEFEYAKRARCFVTVNDSFLLNFDVATVEEMGFYLQSRLDRSEYSYMFPTLELAIKLKHEEAGREAPFAQLLASEIVKETAVVFEDAAAAVPELIRWWKFKNRTHRALTADDAKALRMIVKEFNHRMIQALVLHRQTDLSKQALAALTAAYPNALLIAHKREDRYVALVPATDGNVFVHEHTWTPAGEQPVREWRTVDKRYLRWRVLHTSPAWETWQVGANRREHLTPDEINSLVEQGWPELKKNVQWNDETRRFTRMAAAVVQGTPRLYYVIGEAAIPDRLVDHRITEPEFGYAEIKWRREAGSVVPTEFAKSSAHLYEPDREFGGKERKAVPHGRDVPWITTYGGKPFVGQVLWTNPEAVAWYRTERAKVKVAQRVQEKIRATAHNWCDAYERTYVQAALAGARAKFIADYGDPDLWEGHLKTLKLPTGIDRGGDLRAALMVLAERNLSPDGMTAGEVVDRANKLAPIVDTWTHKVKPRTLDDQYRGLMMTPG